MADTTLDPTHDRHGLSSRWILDGRTRRITVPGSAAAAASERDGLQLKAGVLRRTLLDAERRTDAG